MEINQEAEFVRLISTYDVEIRRYVYTLLPRMEDVDDVMQLTAQAIWHKFAEYDPERPFKTWACRFAYFEVLKFRRNISRSRLIFREDLLELLATEQEKESSLAEQRREALGHCLQTLTDEDRELLRQRYAAEEKIVTLANRHGQPVKQLYNKLDRIRARLALCIDERLIKGGVL